MIGTNFLFVSRLEEKLSNKESEDKVFRQQALSTAQNNKVLADLEAENKALRQQVLQMNQSHKLLSSGRSRSVIQVILKKRFIFIERLFIMQYLHFLWFIFPFILAEGWKPKRNCKYNKSKVLVHRFLVFWIKLTFIIVNYFVTGYLRSFSTRTEGTCRFEGKSPESK